MATVFLVDVKFGQLLEIEGVALAVDQRILAVGPNGRDYPVFVASVGARTFFAQGWEIFLRANNMADGTALLCITSNNGTRLTVRACDGTYRVKPVGNWEVGGPSNDQIPDIQRKIPDIQRNGHADLNTRMPPHAYTENHVSLSDDDLSDDEEPLSKKPFFVPLLRATFNRGLILDDEDKWRTPPKGSSVVITGPNNQKSALAGKRARNCLCDGWSGFKKLFGLRLGDVLEFKFHEDQLQWNMKVLEGAALHRLRNP